MNAASDAKRFAETSRQFNQVPISDKNSRGQKVGPKAPREAQRFKIRSIAERASSRLKQDLGANNVIIRGRRKVFLHLLFGIITLFVDQPLALSNRLSKINSWIASKAVLFA
jgi:hypothetical protein